LALVINSNICIVSFGTLEVLWEIPVDVSHSVWKVVDTNSSVIKIKEINDVYIYDLTLSRDESCLVSMWLGLIFKHIIKSNDNYLNYLKKTCTISNNSRFN
jgi:hypothetical protein